MFKKKALVIGGLTALTVGILGTTAAFAHGPGGRDGGMGNIGGGIIETVAEQLGMERSDLLTELQDGKTVAELAEAQGVDLQDIIDAFVDTADERLTEAVANGNMTQEQADTILPQIEEKVTDAVNNGLPLGKGHGMGRGMYHRAAHGLVTIVSEQLEMDKVGVMEALRDGKTIAQLAEEKGVDTQDIVDAFMVKVEEKLDVAVENGRLTEDEAAEKLEAIEDKVTDKLDDTWPDSRRGEGRRGHRGGGHGFGPGRDFGEGRGGFHGSPRVAPEAAPSISDGVDASGVIL